VGWKAQGVKLTVAETVEEDKTGKESRLRLTNRVRKNVGGTNSDFHLDFHLIITTTTNVLPILMSTSTVTEQVTERAQEEVDALVDSNVDSTDTEVRYMAYGARLRTALRAGHRYIAYVRLPHTCQGTVLEN
jgi:hypothetical protein